MTTANLDNQRLTAQTSGREKGQAIIIIALGFIVLLVFSGLVVDVAMVFTARGQLRRAVDSAGLAAAGQFRLNATTSSIQSAATGMIYAHGIVANAGVITATTVTSVVVETCDTNPSDTTLCTKPLRRKLVRVKAEALVPTMFLQLIGIRTVNVSAESISEAAAVDVVLVLDASESQAYDAPSQQAYSGDASKGCISSDLAPLGSTVVNACAKKCNDNNTCHPFLEVKNAAKDFITHLYQPYDRVAIVSFNREISVVLPLTYSLSAANIAIDAMRMNDHTPGYAAGTPCPFISVGGQRWKCTSSNIGGALLMAENQFATTPYRDDSLWTVIVVGSGGADATDPIPSADPDSANWGFCPGNPQGAGNKDNPPNCRDNSFATHHISTTNKYDAEDYAYDYANALGVPPYGSGQGGIGALVFTIGLGKKVVCTTGNFNPLTGACTPGSWNPAWQDQNSGLPNGAELFLRHLAYTSLSRDSLGGILVDPCSGIASEAQCGNYYYAPNSSGLQQIFLTIAGKIFTRLTN